MADDPELARRSPDEETERGEPDSDSQSTVQEVSLVRESFSSPYPPPAILEQYNAVIPGFAELIIERIDAESSHRRSLEERLVDADINDREQRLRAFRRGQYCALTIGLAGLVIAGIAAVYDTQWIGSIVGGGVLIALVSAFLKSRSSGGEAGSPQQEDE